ncbi:MAG: MATE family efflux transporter [Flavobacteriales bacterium]|nr:MATE family efflux transporter [Flavobacteriales bacterium]
MLSAKEINRLAIPAILFNITEPLIGLADIAIIGQLENDVIPAQGGVGLAAGLIATLIWGFAQMRTAVSAIVSRHYGKNDLKPTYSLIPQSLLVTLFTGLIVALSTGMFYSEIAHFLYGSISNKTFVYSESYFVIRSIGLPMSLGIALFFGIFRGIQNTSWAMYISLFGGAVNIVLDYILILGIENYIKPMGVEGAAIASLIAQVIMFLLCIVFLYKKSPYRLKPSLTLSPFFKEMILIFWNMFVRTLVLNVVFILANRFANKYGDIQLTAYTIGYNIWIFSSFFIDGFSNAGNALAGKFLGENDPFKLKLLGEKLLKINLLISFMLSGIYLVCYPIIGELFNQNTQVLAIFKSTFWIVIIAQPFNSIAFTFDGIFKGLGKALYLRNTLIIGSVFVFIPILLILDHLDFQLSAIWAAMTGWMVFRGSSLFWKFKTLVKSK